MGIERIVTKALAGLEDLTIGLSTVIQSRNNANYNITQLNASLLPIVEATATELTDIADPINTLNKVQRKQVWDTTADKPLWASGTTAAAGWKDATGSTVRTPV